MDTTIWSLALRRRASNLSQDETRLVTRLRELLESGDAILLGVIRQEILSGVRRSDEFSRIQAALRAVDDVAPAVEDYEKAAAIANLCRSNGIAGSPVDYLMCAMAIRRKWPIFTLDRDFEQYQRVATFDRYP